MAIQSDTRARFLGVTLASPATSSAQMRLFSFIGGTVIQRDVQVPARGAYTRPERRLGFVHGVNKVSLPAKSLAESRPPP